MNTKQIPQDTKNPNSSPTIQYQSTQDTNDATYHATYHVNETCIPPQNTQHRVHWNPAPKMALIHKPATIPPEPTPTKIVAHTQKFKLMRPKWAQITTNKRQHTISACNLAP